MIDEQSVFDPLMNEAIEMENKMRQVILAWRTDESAIDEMKQLVDYIDRIPIDFPCDPVEDVRCIYKQALWRRKLHDYERFSLPDIKKLIDEFNSYSSSAAVKSNRDLKKEFDELLNLYSSATEYDRKAKELIDSKYIYALYLLFSYTF